MLVFIVLDNLRKWSSNLKYDLNISRISSGKACRIGNITREYITISEL